MSLFMPRPASRCPRCQLAFGSSDLMLDHLSADHLRKGSTRSRVVARERTITQTASTMSDGVADLERAFRRTHRPHRRRVAMTVAVTAFLLLAVAVVILA